jgi:hypothetical protein
MKTGGLYEVPQDKRWVAYRELVYNRGFPSLGVYFSTCLTLPRLSTLALGPIFPLVSHYLGSLP